MRVFFVLVSFLLVACSNRLLIKDGREFDGSYRNVAESIYRISKECWEIKGSALMADVVVDSVVEIDGISISARFNSFGSGVKNPFIKFFVRSAEGDRVFVDLYMQEIQWVGYDTYLKDAYNWIEGSYYCSR